MGGDQPQRASHSIRLSHDEMADHLPGYVAELLATGRAEERYPLVAAHLATCASCRVDLDELLALTRATYDTLGDPPTTYPAIDLKALLGPREAPIAAPRWSLDALGRWLVELTDGLLAMGRPSPLVGMARADDLLYDLRVPPANDEAPELRVEVFGEPGDSLCLRASVDAPELDPLAMGGVEVALLAGGREWRATTDAVGTASFRGIPRQALAGARIAVRAGRSA